MIDPPSYWLAMSWFSVIKSIVSQILRMRRMTANVFQTFIVQDYIDVLLSVNMMKQMTSSLKLNKISVIEAQQVCV